MIQPTYKHLREIQRDSPSGVLAYAGTVGVHPNPRFYKYYWWVFTHDSPTEGREFLTVENRMNQSEFERKVNEILKESGCAMVYNQKLHRIGPNSIWDEAKLKATRPWVEFADDYEIDPDPETRSGHK